MTKRPSKSCGGQPRVALDAVFAPGLLFESHWRHASEPECSET
jgi:hypothetical protein